MEYVSCSLWKSYLLFLCLVLGSLACSNNGQDDTGGDGTKNKIAIHIHDKEQTIRNFGASDAWTCQFIGLWPEAKKNQVADWLFSLETDNDGRPKGIGLSLWRFNIGAGSAAQDDISDEWRSTEGFLNDDMTYDWSKQAGQRWFMHAARARGVDQFVGFTNSPPVQLTSNGKAYSGNGNAANIAPENYLAFSRFLVDVSAQFAEEGIPFTFLSPFNEPQWDWTDNGQEGSPYTNEEMFAITKKLDSVLTKENMDVRIQVPEAAKLNYLYETADKSNRGEQVSAFFTSQSPLYLGNLQHVDKIISGHSYFTSAPVETLVGVREKVRESLEEASEPVEFWQSEYCILGEQEEVPGPGKDLGIDPALYIARVIHHDLTVANASAWHWWLAVSAYDYKDGLVYVDKNKDDGMAEDSKMLWALGNYSRFIRPGAVRVAVSSESMNVGNAKGIMASSFVNEELNELVMVVINYGYTDSSFLIGVDGAGLESWQPYITGSGADEKLKPLAEIPASSEIVIPKRSIVTLVSEL